MDQNPIRAQTMAQTWKGTNCEGSRVGRPPQDVASQLRARYFLRTAAGAALAGSDVTMIGARPRNDDGDERRQ